MKYHLSTSNFKLKLVTEILIIFVLFGVIEGGVRLGADWWGVPQGNWLRRDFPVTIHQVNQGQYDVIGIGNSRVESGFNPTVFSTVLPETSSYNAGHGGTDATIWLTLADHFFIPQGNPKTIFVILSPLDLGTNNADWNMFTDTFLASEPLTGEPSTYSEYLNQYWYTYRYRANIGEWLRQWQPLPNHPDNRELSGFRANDSVMDVDAIKMFFQIEPEGGRYPYSIQGRSWNTLENFLATTETMVVVVNYPTYIHVMDGYDAYAPIWQGFVDDIAALCAEYGVMFWDLQSLVWDGQLTEQHFSDPTHLNVGGSVIFTTEVATWYEQTLINP